MPHPAAPATSLTPQQTQLREFWNQRYVSADYAYGTSPNDFLAAQQARLTALPTAAAALCLGDGEGRNGVWLAGLGLTVTSVDLADAGLAKAQALATAHDVALRLLQADVTQLDLGQARWGLIASVFMHLPAHDRRVLHRRCAAALQPGGLFIFEGYTPEQIALGTGGPRDVNLLASLADLLDDFAGLPGLELLHQHSGQRPVLEGRLHSGIGHTAQLLLRRSN
ncbi:MAG: hypothetical protein RIQ60_3550 [Pseudomonadota bacterium]|jgi:SAM-dependent methyltransferase